MRSRSPIYSLGGFRGKVGCGAPWPTLARGWFRAPWGFFCVEDGVGGGGSQPIEAIEVEWRVVPGLDHQIVGLDFAGTGLGYVLAVRGAVEPVSYTHLTLPTICSV